MLNAPELYIAISIVVLAVIAVFVIYIMKNKKRKQPSKLAMFGMTLVVLGIIFGVNDRLIGYSFIGAGVLLSVIDMIRKLKKK